MKRFSRFLAAGLFLSAAALAETWNGTLVDVMCKDKDLTTHTRKCAIGCAKSGYGLVLSDGKFLKFDEQGNAKALAALKASSKENDLKAKVSGELEGDLVHVSSVEIE
jgi:hypothetical protein